MNSNHVVKFYQIPRQCVWESCLNSWLPFIIYIVKMEMNVMQRIYANSSKLCILTFYILSINDSYVNLHEKYTYLPRLLKKFKLMNLFIYLSVIYQKRLLGKIPVQETYNRTQRHSANQRCAPAFALGRRQP